MLAIYSSTIYLHTGKLSKFTIRTNGQCIVILLPITICAINDLIFRNHDGHIGHVIQGSLVGQITVVSNHGIESLLGRHLIGAACGGALLEAAVFQSESQHFVHHISEAFIALAINVKRGQSHDHLCIGFGSCAHSSHSLQRLINSSLNLGVAAVVRCQSLHCHGSHIVGSLTRQCPTAVGKLLAENVFHQPITCNLLGAISIGRNLVIMAIQSNQCPDGAIDTLLLHKVCIAETLQQIVSLNVSHIFAQSSQCENYTSIFSCQILVEAASFCIDILLNVSNYIDVITSKELTIGCHTVSRQAKGHPFTLRRSYDRCLAFRLRSQVCLGLCHNFLPSEYRFCLFLDYAINSYSLRCSDVADGVYTLNCSQNTAISLNGEVLRNLIAICDGNSKAIVATFGNRRGTTVSCGNGVTFSAGNSHSIGSRFIAFLHNTLNGDGLIGRNVRDGVNTINCGQNSTICFNCKVFTLFVAISNGNDKSIATIFRHRRCTTIRCGDGVAFTAS